MRVRPLTSAHRVLSIADRSLTCYPNGNDLPAIHLNSSSSTVPVWRLPLVLFLGTDGLVQGQI